ncbi:hypothetical protein L1987_24281 [Smallanthus sonchifolius]|uniref:Uncharacterized protein n=1 Tax=Smallanthus sonchifolius TaxID=185202 RepID=A0ACB9IMM8_9ASTR|nr:hypothetical protein L1987_24281 [Smallanthus sonchifolius]
MLLTLTKLKVFPRCSRASPPPFSGKLCIPPLEQLGGLDYPYVLSYSQSDCCDGVNASWRDSMHIGLLAAAAHAAATNSCFTVFYNPRASPCEFVIPLSKYVKAVYHTRVSVGMRFRMLFETEESSVRRYMGTITSIGDLDPVHWPNSHWRSVRVGWDESSAGERQPRVSLWEIEPLATFPMYPSLFPPRLKRP